MSTPVSVYMGGFPKDITKEKVEQFLAEKKFAPASFDLKVKDRQKFAFGFASYNTKEEADAAIKGLKDVKYGETTLTINAANVISKLFIGKLPEITQEELEKIIKEKGIPDCQIDLKFPNKKKVRALMTFPDAAACSAAVTSLKSITFGDRNVYCLASKSDDKKASLINFPYTMDIDTIKKNLSEHKVNPTEVVLVVPSIFAFLDFKDKVEDFNKAKDILTKNPKIKDSEVFIRNAFKPKVHRKSRKPQRNTSNKRSSNAKSRKTDFVIKVTNIPAVISNDDIKNIFEGFEIKNIRIIKKEQAIAFVSFATRDLRKKAYDSAKDTQVEGKTIALTMVAPRKSRRFTRSRKPRVTHSPNDPKSTTTLFIRNVAFSVNESNLREQFQKYSPVSVVIPRLPYNNKSKGIAFITFNSLDDLNKANTEMNNASIKNRNIHTEIAFERQSKQK